MASMLLFILLLILFLLLLVLFLFFSSTEQDKEQPEVIGSTRRTMGLFGLVMFLSPCFVAAAPQPPATKPPPIEVPIVGRPGHFSEAVGKRFEVSMRVSRNEMHVGQSFTLTVRVASLGPWQHAPERPVLDELPKF